jgi:predicted enzyme involved in methoxymalonyl-ACP biosynthesis
MISVIICKSAGPDWLIDTWLMSCRVLNRKVERMTLNQLVAAAKSAGVRALIGEYIRTERNGMVKDHYARLGFEPLEQAEQSSRWRLDVQSYVPEQVPIEVVETSAEPVVDLRARAS